MAEFKSTTSIHLKLVDDLTAPLDKIHYKLNGIIRSFSALSTVDTSLLHTQIADLAQPLAKTQASVETFNTSLHTLSLLDFNNLEVLQNGLDINEKMEQTINNLSQISQKADEASKSRELNINARGMKELANSADKAEKEINDAKKKQEEFNQKIQGGVTGFKSMVKQIGGAALAIAGISSIGSAVSGLLEYSDSLINTRSRLDTLRKDSTDISEFFDKITASANRSYSSISMTAEAVADIANANSQLFSSDDELIRYAETLNKMFITESVKPQQRESVMFNLAQAMSVGVFRGQDLNTVQSNMPELLKMIERYKGWEEGSAKIHVEKMGGLPIEELKGAILQQSSIIDEKFETMNITWGDWKQRFKNTIASMTINPIVEKLEKFFNSKKFRDFFMKLTEFLGKMSKVLLSVVDVFISAFNIIYDNWSLLLPVFVAAAAGLGVFIAALGAYTVSSLVAGAATLTWAWPIALIGVVIGAAVLAVYGLVAAFNYLTGKSISATGIIFASVQTMIAAIVNPMIHALNVINVIREALVNMFKYPEYTAQRFFQNIISMAENFLGSILGIDFSGMFADLLNISFDLEKPEGYKEYKQRDYMGSSLGATAAYDIGKSVDNLAINTASTTAGVISGSGDVGMAVNGDNIAKQNSDTLKDISNYTKATSRNTEGLSDSAYSYLKDFAIRESINSSSSNVNIVLNANASVNNEADRKSFIKELEEMLSEDIATSVPGVESV